MILLFFALCFCALSKKYCGYPLTMISRVILISLPLFLLCMQLVPYPAILQWDSERNELLALFSIFALPALYAYLILPVVSWGCGYFIKKSKRAFIVQLIVTIAALVYAYYSFTMFYDFQPKAIVSLVAILAILLLSQGARVLYHKSRKAPTQYNKRMYIATLSLTVSMVFGYYFYLYI